MGCPVWGIVYRLPVSGRLGQFVRFALGAAAIGSWLAQLVPGDEDDLFGVDLADKVIALFLAPVVEPAVHSQLIAGTQGHRHCCRQAGDKEHVAAIDAGIGPVDHAGERCAGVGPALKDHALDLHSVQHVMSPRFVVGFGRVVRSYNGIAGCFSVNAERPVPGDLRTWELAFANKLTAPMVS